MQPKSPNPDFDFMLKENPRPRRWLPALGLPKPLKIGLGVLAFIILLIIFSSIRSSRSAGKVQPYVNVMARAQETLRVTKQAQQLNFQDPQTQALAATVVNALSSDQTQLAKYMVVNHYKYSRVQLAADTDKSEDSALASAAQNNTLDTAYISYLKDALAKYEGDLKLAYGHAGPHGKQLLSDSFDGAETLLTSPPLKS